MADSLHLQGYFTSLLRRKRWCYLKSKPCRFLVFVGVVSATCVLVNTWNGTGKRFLESKISTKLSNQTSSVNWRQMGCKSCPKNRPNEDILKLNNDSFNDLSTWEWKAGQVTEEKTTIRDYEVERLTTKWYGPASFTGSVPGHRSNHGCTQEFRSRHLLAADISDRTGNIIFKFASLLATAERTCYTAVRTAGRIDNFDDIFELRNVELRNYDPSTFKRIDEPGAGIHDVTITSQINPAFNWTLGGYRQSFKYFQNYSELIRSSFRFRQHIQVDVLRYLNVGPLFRGKQKVCVHVRRGDFLESWAIKIGFGVSDLEYLSRAKTHIKRFLAHRKFDFIVMSDHLEWCKKNIKGFGIYYSPFRDGGRDLFLLTQCDHTIITGGTFGWMGAWLNETGIVIYDKSFPKPNTPLASGYKEGDYYPDHWIGL